MDSVEKRDFKQEFTSEGWPELFDQITRLCTDPGWELQEVHICKVEDDLVGSASRVFKIRT